MARKLQRPVINSLHTNRAILLAIVFVFGLGISISLSKVQHHLPVRDLKKLQEPFEKRPGESCKADRSTPLNKAFSTLCVRYGFHPRGIIDVGANVGDWSREMKLNFPQANYFGVEANADHIQRLEDTFNSTRDDYAIALLGKENRKNVEYYVNKAWLTGAGMYRERSKFYDAHNHDFEVRRLEMKTLDGLLRGKGPELKFPDVLKIDAQGAEIDVLRGAQNTLKFVTVIAVELSVLQYNVGAPLAGEMFEFMNKIGFQLFDIETLNRRKDVLWQMDALFVNKFSPLLKEVHESVDIRDPIGFRISSSPWVS